MEKYDVIIIGSGAGGLMAAIKAAKSSLRVLLIEKRHEFGGSSAMSGGTIWVPNCHVSKKIGIKDSFEEALTYMETVIGEEGPWTSKERKIAYIENINEIMHELETEGIDWVPAKYYPDYYPELPGGKSGGRSIDASFFDLRKLDDWAEHLHKMGIKTPFPIHSGEVGHIPKMLRRTDDFWKMAKIVMRSVPWKLKGKKYVSNGQTLIAHLMFIALKYQVNVWLKTSFQQFIIENDQVIGITCVKDGKKLSLYSDSVIVAAGGFSHNTELRQKYHNVGTDWSSANPENTGDVILQGIKLGIDMALLDDAWWGPATIKPDGERLFILSERSVPHTIIVDQLGYRYFNESSSYIDAGHAMLEHNNGTPSIPSWMILDKRHRNRFMFHTIPPLMTPKRLIDEGFFIKASTIEELAIKCKIPPQNLNATVERFNRFVEKGIDKDFGRGNSVYDNYYGDPTYKNPNLGSIDKAPFWAVRIYPGDLGTKGGFITDIHGRVLKNGKPIIGLYATGNSTASVMGRTYPGAGSTLGPTMAFGYAAVKHILAEQGIQEKEIGIITKNY